MQASKQQTANTFFVGVDGSDASEKAFQCILKDVQRPQKDTLVAGTISDKKKETYLPWNMRHHYIADSYESKIVQLGTYGRFAQREVPAGKTTKEALWDLACQEKASCIVVGWHGRKGPKKDETVAGTAVEFLSLHAQFPVMILKDIKNRSEKPDGKLRYAVCFDKSKKGQKALDVVLNMMKISDKLVTISVQESGVSQSAIEQYVKDQCSSYGITNFEMKFLPKPDDLSTYQVIKKHLKYEAQDTTKHGYVDFVAVGNGGARFDSMHVDKFLGSVANAVIRAKKMNCIFVA